MLLLLAGAGSTAAATATAVYSLHSLRGLNPEYVQRNTQMRGIGVEYAGARGEPRYGEKNPHHKAK